MYVLWLNQIIFVLKNRQAYIQNAAHSTANMQQHEPCVNDPQLVFKIYLLSSARIASMSAISLSSSVKGPCG